MRGGLGWLGGWVVAGTAGPWAARHLPDRTPPACVCERRRNVPRRWARAPRLVGFPERGCSELVLAGPGFRS